MLDRVVRNRNIKKRNRRTVVAAKKKTENQAIIAVADRPSHAVEAVVENVRLNLNTLAKITTAKKQMTPLDMFQFYLNHHLL